MEYEPYWPLYNADFCRIEFNGERDKSFEVLVVWFEDLVLVVVGIVVEEEEFIFDLEEE